MDGRLFYIGGLIAVLATPQLAAQLAAQDASVLKRAPVVMSLSDEQTAGKSPYADWPDQGMRPLPDRAAMADEIFAGQAEAIAAAYGGEPWRWQEHECAGWPSNVHSRAFPSDTGRYCGYYVGGGAAWRGEGPYDHEGTWGWDYSGCWLHRRVALLWSHCRRQSGTGSYQTDGPKLIRHE